MEHGQQDAEPIGTILSGIATLLRELGDQLDIAAARVDDTTSLDTRLKKLESWAAGAGQDITALQTRMDKVDSAGSRPAVAARPTRAERREAAERAELEAAASTPAMGVPDSDPSVPSELLALPSATDDETGGSAGASTDGDRQESATEAQVAPPRLAPVPRLQAPELTAGAAGTTAAPEDSTRGDTAVPDHHSAPGDGVAAAPNRRLPRAGFPRRQPARAESEGGSSPLGSAGPRGGTGPRASTAPLDSSGSPENGGLREGSGLLEGSGGVEGSGLLAGSSDVDRTVNGEGDDVDDRQQSGSEIGRRSAHSRGGTEAEAPSADTSGLPGTPGDSDGNTTGVTPRPDTPSAGNAEQPVAPAGLPERVPGTPSARSRLPRRAAAYTPPSENGTAAGESATPSRAERRRLAEAGAAQSDSVPESAHAAPARVPAPSAETDRPTTTHSRPAHTDGAETRSAHAEPIASRHAETSDQPDPARHETANTADPAGPAVRALGIGSGRGEGASEFAAQRLADSDAPVTEVITGLSALRHLADESDSPEQGSSSALPQRGSRRSDRREAAEPERSVADSAPGARPQSHRAVIDNDGIAHSLRAEDSNGALPAHGPSLSLPQRDTRDPFPQRDPSHAVPRHDTGTAVPHTGTDDASGQREPGAALSSHDTGIGLPRREAGSLPTRDTSGPLSTQSSASLPRRDHGAGFPPGDTGNGLPRRHAGGHTPQPDTGTGFPQSDTGTGLPSRESADASVRPDAADLLPQRDTASTRPAGDAAGTFPGQETSGVLPHRDAGVALPQRGASRALPQRETSGVAQPAEANDLPAERGTRSARAELGTEDATAPHEAGGSLSAPDFGGAGTLPRRDPGHAAAPRDAVAEIAADISGPRSAGRHNSRPEQTDDLLAESAPLMDLLRGGDSATHGEAGTQHPEQRDARFEGIRPAGSTAPESWQGDLDRLAAETAYVDGDPGSTDRPAEPTAEPSAATAVPQALHDWMDQPVPSVAPASLPRRGDGPSGVTRRVEPAGITPRPAPAQPNPFGPPTSALTAGVDGSSGDMPFDLDAPGDRPEVSSPDTAEQAPIGRQRPTIEDNAHVDKLQAMLDELKRNPAGPFGRALNTPPENSGH